MTVPADGIERLIHFVDARIAQLNLSKEEVARRGGPNRDTLAKIEEYLQEPYLRALFHDWLREESLGIAE